MFNISVIITVYNDACYLSKALNSVESQSIKPREVIVIDDGSKDDLASEFISRNSYSFPVFFHKKKNGGASDARNYGLNLACGEFVAFLDVDDFWLADNLRYKYEKLKGKPPSFSGCYGGFISKPDGIESRFKYCERQAAPDDIGKSNGFPGGAPMYLFRKAALDAVGGFDVDLKQNEDFDLILRLIQAGFNIVGDNSFGYIRNIRDGSLTRNKNYKKSYSNTAAFLDKAEFHGYFSEDELSNRRMLNALSCLKSCFFEIKDFRFQKKMLDDAFANIGYVRIRYYPLFFYKIVLGFFL